MVLADLLKKSIEEAFKENSREIIRHDNSYAFAREFMGTFNDKKMKEYNEKVPDISGVLKEARSRKKRTVKERLEGRRLSVEMVLNRHDGVEIYVPVRYANGTNLEKDLVGHVVSTFARYAPNVKVGTLGDYVAVSGQPILKDRDLKKDLERKTPEVMGLGNVSVVVYEVTIPVAGTFKTEYKKLVKVMTPSAIKYKLIPVHAKDREFFPRYKEPFEIVSEHGQFTAQVTSSTKFVHGRGNYICSTGDGALGNLIKKLKLKPGNKVEITAIKPKRIYQIRKVR